MPEESKVPPAESGENRERELVENLTWGEGYPTIENHSVDFACKNSECALHGKPQNFEKVAIGVKEAPAGMQQNDKHYAMVCECPECFEKYWFHAGDDMALIFKRGYGDGMFSKAKPKKR